MFKNNTAHDWQRPHLFDVQCEVGADVADAPHKRPVVSLLVVHLQHKTSSREQRLQQTQSAVIKVNR